jgi:uncharacterized SAM-binding protein YcdF (DUF218 family)
LILRSALGAVASRRLHRLLLILKYALFCLVFSATGIVAAYGVLLAIAEPALSVPTRVEHADLIIVLGGDASPRAAVAAALFKSGQASWILISGDGDCQDIRRILISDAVPAAAIGVECTSRSTMENAEYSAAILQRMGVRRALLVTSWYHVRRALGSFRKAAPTVEFLPVSAREDGSFWHMAWYDGGSRIVAEYAKIGWYLLHYGVCP